MSNRSKITTALVDLFNTNLNGARYSANIYRKAENKLRFWDEINQHPYVSVTAGSEYRQYLPANFKWGFLTVTIRVYVKEQNPQERLEEIFEDMETLLDANNELLYDDPKTTEEISILSIVTDEGVLHPLGVGEMQLQIRYDV